MIGEAARIVVWVTRCVGPGCLDWGNGRGGRRVAVLTAL